MRIDYEYLSRILDVFLEAAAPTVTYKNFEDLRQGDDGEHRFVFHIEILVDKELIVSVLENPKIGIKRDGQGNYMISIVPWRLTADGHDFASALIKPTILAKVKEKFAKEGLSAVIDIVKKLGEKQAEKYLGEL